ncbi:MAG TPA: hypothetical protein VFN08_20765 [Gemmatimonadales bacterium]|jgi:hypothetical protein|nr:hypothetical protein [Gemmatimonadales bacterium]
MNRPGIRQVLLRPEFAQLYPGIAANEWLPAAVVTDQVLALKLQGKERVPLTRDRALDERHFEFRGVASAGQADALRQARQDERREERRRRTDVP